MKFTDLGQLIPDSILDVRYATADNIAGRKLYERPAVKLLPAAAQALAGAADVLHRKRLRLVLWDGYRPEAVQQILRSIVQNDQYVLLESNHCKGRAIDLTLAYQDGTYLDMGTGFDDFSPRAHLDATDITQVQRQNRELLAAAMTGAGFTPWPYEWWHFDYLQ